MSGKRRATGQISKEDFHREEESDDEQQSYKQSVASAETLSKRKILRPKSRLTSSNSSSISKPSPFAFGNSTATAVSTASTNPFGNISSISNGTSNTFGGINPIQKSIYPSIINSQQNSIPDTSKLDKNTKLKALNDNFIKSINNGLKSNPIADLSPIIQKYLNYIEEINSSKKEIATPSQKNVLPFKPVEGSNAFANGNALPKPIQGFSHFSTPSSHSTPAPTPQTVPTPTQKIEEPREKESQAEPIKLDTDTDTDSDDEIKVEGPKFVMGTIPTVKKSVFSFGPKPVPKKVDSDSDSEDDIKVEGPKFSIGGASKVSTGVFKLGAPTTSAFSFGKTEEKKDEAKPNPFAFLKPAEEKKDEVKTPFSFAKQDNKVPTTSTPFSFNKPTSTDSVPAPVQASTPLFSLNKTEPKSESTPAAFPFAKSTEGSAFGSSKPFSFGQASKTIEPAESKSEVTPSFSFSKPTESSAFGSSKPFGQTTTETKPFSFSQPSTTEEKKLFSFGSSLSTTEIKETKPSFSFSQISKPEAKTDEDSKINNLTWNQSKPISFSNPTDASGKPASIFPSFGASTTSADKPLFGGASNSGFGTSNSSGFNFSFNGNASKPAETATNNDDEDKVEEGEVKGDFKVAELTDKVESTETGEENETVTYTKRCKLMLFKPKDTENPYQSKGLGEIKILKHNETGKTRILMRADSSNRVLLNTLINKDMSYSPVGNGNTVRVPVVNADQTIDTFMIKVKTPEDGNDLLNSLNEGKN